MKNLLKYSLLVMAIAFTASTSAHAGGVPVSSVPPRAVAPEVDPSMAITGLALLAGTLTVMRAKRAKG